MSFLAAIVWSLALPQDFFDEFEGPAGAWERVRSEEHPAYNRVDAERGYLRMVTQGGKTAVELSPEAAWTVDPARSYRLTLLARLEGTRRNAASASLFWRDAQLRPLGPPQRSVVLSSPGEWQELALEVPRVPAGAVRATIRLDFEGPDVRGEAGFDRLRLSACALVEVRPAGRDLPVFSPGERIALEATAHGIGAEALLEVLLRSADGNESARTEWPVAAGVAARLELTPLKPGSYRVETTARRRGETLAARDFPLLVPNPAWLRSDAAGYGARFDPSTVTYWGAGELVRLTGIRRAVVATGGPGTLDLLRALAGTPVTIVGVGDPSVRGYGEFVDSWETARPRVPGGRDGAELLRRLVRLAAASTERVDVTFGPEMFDGSGFPRDSFLALRAANDVLSGAVARPDPQSPLIQAAFDKAGEMVLVLWTEGPAAVLTLPWGDRAEVYDPWAGIRRVGPEEPLKVTDSPLFVGRVDGALLTAWSGLRFEGGTLPMRRGPVSGSIRFRPPATREAGGDMRFSIRAPDGWVVRPAESVFSGSSGRDASQDLTFLLPADEKAGRREMEVVVTYSEGDRRRTLRKTIPLQVTSPIEIKGDATDSPDGKKVSLRIANGLSREVTLVSTVRLPHLPERLEFLGTLPAGGTSRILEYVVKAADPLDRVEVLVEERTGERHFARAVISLR